MADRSLFPRNKFAKRHYEAIALAMQDARFHLRNTALAQWECVDFTSRDIRFMSADKHATQSRSYLIALSGWATLRSFSALHRNPPSKFVLSFAV